ncbi:MAG: carbohydrate ABC transporter permease [Candidatus Niameybacter stercoravium]|nr:carbohydrate ABC transporter permease [Candidatus Niameybacter stercoravium]
MGMSILSIMIIMPLFSLAVKWHIAGTKFLLIGLYVCMNVPFTTTFLLNFFGKLSTKYEEATAMDGCSPMKIFWKIMLPLAQPGIITVTIFNFLGVWNEYFMTLIFASSDDMKSVGVGLVSMINAMKYTGDYGGLFAGVVIVFMSTFLLYIFLSEKIIAGVTGGGLKG